MEGTDTDQILSIDPLHAFISNPALILLPIAIIVLPYLLKAISAKNAKSPKNTLYSLTNYQVPASATFSEKLWEIGISERSMSIAEDGELKGFEFTIDLKIPSVSHCYEAFKKAICEPLDGKNPLSKPAYVIFLDSVILPQNQIQLLTERLESTLGIKVTTKEEIAQQKPELLAPKQTTPDISFSPAGKQEAIPFNPQPTRGCCSCRTDIVGKVCQCSACKAVIYCSVVCAKADWPNHKQTCAGFKKTMLHINEWDLHDFPFTFYPKEKPLCNYNVVPYLSSISKHNIGLFQRLCGCFQQIQYGILGSQLLAQFQSSKDSQREVFNALGLDEELFPLSKKFDSGLDI